MIKKILLTCLVVFLAIGISSCSSKKGKPGDLSESDLAAAREGRFGEGGIPIAEGEGVFRDVHFDYDSSRINDQARQEVEQNVEILKEHSDWHVTLEGHCDERGTADYNLALGSQRARAVKEVFASHGIPLSRLDTISYGAEVPLDPGHNESAWAKNRRVHLSAGSAKAKTASNEDSSNDRARFSDDEGRQY